MHLLRVQGSQCFATLSHRIRPTTCGRLLFHPLCTRTQSAVPRRSDVTHSPPGDDHAPCHCCETESRNCVRPTERGRTASHPCMVARVQLPRCRHDLSAE